MRSVIIGIAVCLAPALALADHDDWEDVSHGYNGRSNSKIDSWERENQREQMRLQAQRDYYYQQEEAGRQKKMLKELRDLNDNQRRMMGEEPVPRFSLDGN